MGAGQVPGPHPGSAHLLANALSNRGFWSPSTVSSVSHWAIATKSIDNSKKIFLPVFLSPIRGLPLPRHSGPRLPLEVVDNQRHRYFSRLENGPRARVVGDCCPACFGCGSSIRERAMPWPVGSVQGADGDSGSRSLVRVHDLIAHERKPHRNARSHNVPAAVTTTKRGKAELVQKVDWPLGKYQLGSGSRFFARQRPSRRQRLREFEGAVGSRGSAWSAAASRRCVRRAGDGSWPSNGRRSVRVEAKAPGTRAAGGPLRAGKHWPSRWFSFGSTNSGGRIGVRNRDDGLGRGAVDSSCRGCVHCSGPASFGLRPARKLSWVCRPSGAASARPCCSGTAAPPGVQKLKCAAIAGGIVFWNCGVQSCWYSMSKLHSMRPGQSF